MRVQHFILRWVGALIIGGGLLRPVSAQSPQFDANQAWRYLIAQCDFGPRTPGTPAHQKCLNYLESELKKYTPAVERQTFWASSPKLARSVPLTNLIARFSPTASRRLLLCAHWDTRPWADQDLDPAHHEEPILGANDGASGVAVLLEIARCLAAKPPNLGVDIVFFDGEDMGREGYIAEWLLGSREYAKKIKLPLPEAAILLDMVGDADLTIPLEAHSQHAALALLNEVFDVAEKLQVAAFVRRPGPPVFDDHISLIEADIPAIDLIDFDYPYWHTVEDTPQKCSAKSLEAVGRVVLAWVYQRAGK